MKKFSITRSVYAEPMTRLAYNNLRNWTLPADENGDDEGYKITDSTTKHVSWLPKSEFDNLNKVEQVGKTLGNTDSNGATKNVKDIKFWGDGNIFKLISKASSNGEGWMKSTKAMDTGNGCVIQVTTQQGNNVAEALTFVPGVTIHEIRDEQGKVVSRKIMY